MLLLCLSEEDTDGNGWSTFQVASSNESYSTVRERRTLDLVPKIQKYNVQQTKIKNIFFTCRSEEVSGREAAKNI